MWWAWLAQDAPLTSVHVHTVWAVPPGSTRLSVYVQRGAAFLPADFNRYALGGYLEETPLQLQRGLWDWTIL